VTESLALGILANMNGGLWQTKLGLEPGSPSVRSNETRDDVSKSGRNRDAGQAMITEIDLTGRVAIITGAGSQIGIGFATARLLSKMGSRVMITSAIEFTKGSSNFGISAPRSSASLVISRTRQPPQSSLLSPWIVGND